MSLKRVAPHRGNGERRRPTRQQLYQQACKEISAEIKGQSLSEIVIKRRVEARLNELLRDSL